MKKWFILFFTLISFVGLSVYAFGKQDTELEGLEAFVRLVVDGKEFQCFVHYTNPPREWAAIKIKDESGLVVFEHEPGMSHLIRLFPTDVTGDGEPELISLWTHGIVEQIFIISLTLGASQK